MSNKHPVIVWELPEGCDEFQRGFQYKIEDVAGDNFWCRNEPHVRQFLEHHGCYAVRSAEMEVLRQTRLDQSRE